MNESNESVEAGAIAFDNLGRQALKAGTSIATALAAGQIEGRKLDDVLRDVGSRLGSIALRTAGTSLTTSLASSLSQTLVGAVTSTGLQSTAFATPASLANFGQSFDQTQLPSAPQAISAQNIRPMNITLNISTPDAASFRNSEAQVSAALARAVQRGQRSL
jgi:hypothetical protein